MMKKVKTSFTNSLFYKFYADDLYMQVKSIDECE